MILSKERRCYMLNRDNLHAYQERAVKFINDVPKCALWLDLGLGKSISTLTAITDLIDSFTVSKVLVIAPLRVANTTWGDEIKNWDHTKHLTYRICTGSTKNRQTQLMLDADIYIINRENVKWLVDYYGDKWPFDCVVIDEASSFKSSKSQRFKALRKVYKHIDRLIELTGTPSPNGMMDVWAQIALLDNGVRLGRNMTQFKQRYFESDYMGYSYTIKDGAQKRIEDKISDIVISMKKEDYLELPDRIDLTHKITLSPGELKQYKELEKNLFAEFEGNEVLVDNAAVLAGKLLQLCNGNLYLDNTGRFTTIHNRKLDALKDIVEDNSDENILVAYNYKFDLEQIKAKFPDAVVLSKSGEEIEAWNKGEIKMLLAHPASASMGLNLQKGGSMIVWYGLTWSLEYYQQFCARLHRQGQTKPVRIVHIVAENCKDEDVMLAIENKAETQEELLQALKVKEYYQ